jgi:hypothetical protein
VARARQHGTVVATDGAGPHDCDFHCFTFELVGSDVPRLIAPPP